MMTRRELFFGAALPAFASSGEVPAVDVSRIRPADFANDELDLPYHLVHFARLANAVRMEEPNRGFIELAVWRHEKDNQPHNARIMENILSLAWFYTAARKWNPYRGMPQLRARLDAALDFWCRIQAPDGRFSEYRPQGWNLAATAFSVKFMAEALRLLHAGPPIDAGIHKRAIEACRKALRITLTDEELYNHGRAFSNQYTNIFAGGPAFLAVYPDAELTRLLGERMKASNTEFQSPAGYFYESNGPDFGYNLGTHHENIQMAYHYWRKTPYGDMLVEQERRFCEWLSYNALPEPGTDFFVMNRAIETRQKHATYARFNTPVADRCVIARAFAEVLRLDRTELEKTWPRVKPLEIGAFRAFQPYVFLQRSHYTWNPTAAQIAEAASLCAAWKAQPFVKKFTDPRRPSTFLYVRRPGYYAAFAAGHKITSQQRYGLTLVWDPKTGVVLQSQTGGEETAWGTGSESAGVAKAEFSHAGAKVRYPLTGGGVKEVVFLDDRIAVSIERTGEITERIPVFDPARIRTTAQKTVKEQKASPLKGKRFYVVTLTGTGKLDYDTV